MDPDIAARLARYAKERRTRSYLDDEPLEGTGWTKELDEMRELEFDPNDAPDYDWENDVEVTDDNYTKDEKQRIQKLCEELAAKVKTKLNEVTSVAYNPEGYEGLGSSSRVTAFRFQPNKGFSCSDIKKLDNYVELVESGDVESVISAIKDDESLEGVVWVKFYKHGTEVDYGTNGNLTYKTFEFFKEGGSLGSYGNAVRTVLEPFGYTVAYGSPGQANQETYTELRDMVSQSGVNPDD